MNTSPYRVQKTKEVKVRLKLAMNEYGLNEITFAKPMGITEEQARKTLCKVDKEERIYQLPYIFKMHEVLDSMNIPKGE